MANTIQIKRAADNGTSSVPSGLASGEMALDQAGRKLYIGRHNNSSVQVAHLPMLDDLTAGNGITLSAASGENDRGRTVTLRQDQSAVWATDSAKGLAAFSTDNFLVSSGVVTIKDNGVALGTETTGNYMSNVTAGTGVTVTHTQSEGSSAAIAIGQAVATSSSPTFAGITGGNVTVGIENDNTITTTSGNLTIDANGSSKVIISGDLQIDGTTTTVNSTVTTVDDPIFTVGGDTDASDDDKDKGIAFKWHNGSTAKVGFFGFNESSGKFTFIPDSTESGAQVISGTAGAVEFGAIEATSIGGPSGSTCTINGGTF